MLDDLDKLVKEKLLQELIDRMDDAGGDKLRPKDVDPKGMGVEVQAKDPEALKEGLDKAKELVGQADVPEMSDEDPDEQLLSQLIDDDDKDQR